MSDRLVLGIDGGGTNTRVAILNHRGELVGWGTSGSANYDDIGTEAAKENIAAAVDSACWRAGIARRSFDAAFFGMAGVVSDGDHRVIRGIVDALEVAAPEAVDIHHDIRIALAGALVGRPGIVLITGTGSSCYGMNAQGDEWRSGGWGGLIADEGSGYWLGHKAMRAAVRAFDGRGKSTRLLDDVMGHLCLNDINDIMHRIYHVRISRAETAAMAVLVIEAARAGDSVALDLLQEAIDELALAVYATAAQLNMTDTPEISMVGGLQKVKDVFVGPLHDAVRRRLPGSTLTEPVLSPVMGACLLCLQRLAIEPGAVHDTLLQSERQLTEEMQNSG